MTMQRLKSVRQPRAPHVSKRKDGALLIKKFKASWRKAFLRFIPLGGFSTHNVMKIFHSGDEAFLTIFNAISASKQSIYLETYILAPDRIGLWLRDAVIEASARGVKITILYDHFGSSRLSGSFLAPMHVAGIKVMAFNPIWPWRRRGPLLFRDHRKIIIIDEKIAFCGSMNISADYAGPIYGNDRFRDTLARIEGPAVKDLLAITLESIAESEFEEKPERLSETLGKTIDTKKAIKLFFHKLLPSSEIISAEQDELGTLVQVLRSNMRRNPAHIQKSLEESVNRAVNYCYFTTPYFLPQDGLRKAIINAKHRGVDVRILTAGLSDVPLVRYAARHVYMGLLKKGVRIFEMTQKTLHAKIATIDGVYSSIGSYNLDHWSARRNLEVNLCIIDGDIALDLKKQFEIDVASSFEIDKTEFLSRSALRRFLCWLAYVILRI
jgi:cardiolipin synthase